MPNQSTEEQRKQVWRRVHSWRAKRQAWSCQLLVLLFVLMVVGLRATEICAQTSTKARTRPTSISTRLPKIPGAKPRNIILILTDDHRYDALGFLKGQSFLETPALDAMARQGVHLKNAFVTTALCSPSRASILTGHYAHRHRVVDNNNPVGADLVFFTQYLQSAGYRTAMVGKWHMGGEVDDPQRGFDHWVSFKGQGTYLPSRNGLNVDGKRVPQKGYITDELTDYAIEWLDQQSPARPFMLYLSHKGVHAEFEPAERHKGRYQGESFRSPLSQDSSWIPGFPMWVQNQRNSWHGIEYPYHSDLDIASYYKRYAETLLGVDDSVARVNDWLRRKNLLDSTLVLYMGDNGFAFGEHGLIDKRTAYEESMRIPMLLQCPELIAGGKTVEEVVANIDVAPTLLEAAGLRPPASMDGRSFLGVVRGTEQNWRTELLYEYYWERNFPQTPTIHALRGDRYKYIHYHGIWDTDELFDLREDPFETRNLLTNPEHQPVVREMNRKLFDLLEATGGLYLPLYRDRGGQNNLRHADRSKAAPFPDRMLRR